MKKIQLFVTLVVILFVFACKNTTEAPAATTVDTTAVSAPAPVDTMAAAVDTAKAK